MTDNERLANEMVEQAYGRLADGQGNLEPGDKVIIVLNRNNDNVLKLIHKVSCANGKPIALLDKAKAMGAPAISGGGVIAVLLLLLDRL